MSKFVREGKVYDTDKAELVFQWNNGYGDELGFDHCEQALYRTEKGAYFLVGDNVAALYDSGQVRPYTETGGKECQPISSEEALEWLESHGADGEAITRYFDLPEA